MKKKQNKTRLELKRRRKLQSIQQTTTKRVTKEGEETNQNAASHSRATHYMNGNGEMSQHRCLCLHGHCMLTAGEEEKRKSKNSQFSKRVRCVATIQIASRFAWCLLWQLICLVCAMRARALKPDWMVKASRKRHLSQSGEWKEKWQGRDNKQTVHFQLYTGV